MDTATVVTQPPPRSTPTPAPPARWRFLRRGLLAAGLLIVIAGAVWFWPVAWRAFLTVSTDDAYVNGHVTTVSPRVAGQVLRVAVDDNFRVRKGDLLVELDKEPYRVQVGIKRAALAAAEANLTAARADVRGLEANARSLRWKTQNAVEQVTTQIAALKAAVATHRSRLATLDRARADYERSLRIRTTGAVSQEELDAQREAVRVAEAAADETLQQAVRIRVGLGLEPKPPDGGDLTEVPADLPQRFSTVRQALGELAQAMARLGLPLVGTNETPDEVLARFRKLDASGDIDRILARLVPDAPEVKQAEAKRMQAERDLAQAELDLRYCDVVAEIDGVVTRRSVNPGNTVQAGQALMAVRSLTEVWVDANFKETQLADLAIGQRAEIYADAYGNRRVFRGRVTGFTQGTGSTLALLPPQNATGNFVKVVQRLPVRIEFDDYDPDRDTLFAGLSVVPYVFVNEPATGPDAGRKLRQAPQAGAPR